MGTVHLIAEAVRFGTLLSEAVQWCDRITLCLSAPRSERGTVETWTDLLAAHAKYDRVIVHNAEASEGWLLHRLHETSTLHLIQGPSDRFHDQLLCFERRGNVQLFLARAPLTRAAFRGECGAIVHFQGESTDEFAISFQRLNDEWRQASRVPTGSELDALTTSVRPNVTGQIPAPVDVKLTVVTERDALRQAVAKLFAIERHADERELSIAPAEGEPLLVAKRDTWRMSLRGLSDGVRLEMDDGAPSGPEELVLRAADSTSASSGLVLSDPSGNLSLAWRGGLLGPSEKKNQTLWSQCRLPMLEVHAPGFGTGSGEAQRVALVACAGAEFAAQLAAFAEEVRRLRDVLVPRQRQVADRHSDFATRDREEQVQLVWRYLVGLGALPLDEAVTVSAQGLREDSYVQYQRLRRDGPLYECLSQLLTREASAGSRFDRPGRGTVRAVQPQLDSYEREDWLDCLVNALPEGEVLDRATAMRRIFNYARETWGLTSQRLRPGGKSEKALKSALNSAIRRGLLRRVGAAYVEKVTSSTQARSDSVPASSGALERGSDVPAPIALPAMEAAPADQASGEATPLAESPHQFDASADLLARALIDLRLPQRTLNWGERRGLVTLRDLVAWHPDAFAAEPNVGRLTVTETRVAVEAALGREWEEIWGQLEEPKTPPPGADETDLDAASGPLPSPDHSRWNRRRAELSEAQRGLPVTRLDLPTRMRSYCEQHGLQTVGELLAVPRDQLLAQPNVGRASLLQTLAALDETLLELEQPVHDDQLVSGWRRLVQRLPALQRMILVRRSGSYGPRETLESLGETLGLTRERVRQIEAGCLDSIRQRWALVDALQQRLTQAFAGGRCAPLDLLINGDPWWQGIERHPDLADYLFERLLGGSVHRLVLQQQDQITTFFARFTQQDLHEAQRELLTLAAQISTPARLGDYEPLVENAIGRLDPAMREALQIVLEDQLNLDEADPEWVLSFGNTKPDRVIALLASQPEPIAVSAVFEALGRCKLPDEALYFRRGVVGLEQHFPEFRLWLERLVPACLEQMAELPAGRQWMVTELHEALREAGKLPEWLGHWHLASLLRRSGQVEYLGRLRVALPSDGNRQERIRHSDALLGVLRAEGNPLTLATIAERVRQQTDIQDETLSSLLLSSPFVKLGANLYGLIERDVPGGSQAIARAVEAVLQTLAVRQRGLTTYQAYQLAAAEVSEAWSPDLVLSLLRSEPQLRLSRSGHVGLASWDDVRAPTRGEFIRQQVEKAGGRLELDTLQMMLRDVYGRALQRTELGTECYRNELQLEGDAIALRAAVEKEPQPSAVPDHGFAPPSPGAPPDSTPAPPSPPSAIAGATSPQLAIASSRLEHGPPIADPSAALDLAGRVQGIPAAARQHFEELLQEPIQPWAELLQQARAHLADIDSASHHNEFIDVSLAKALVERLERLLEQVEALSPITRRIAQAAVLYFISTEDAEDDFDLGGLDDDQAVLAAVVAHLELA